MALVVAGLVLLGARAITEAAQQLAVRNATTIREMHLSANGYIVARRLIGAAMAPQDMDTRFNGDSRQLFLLSHCQTPSGWSEPCRVRLAVERSDSSLALLAYYAESAVPLPLLRAKRDMELRYLQDAAYGGLWYTSWGPSFALPVAVGVVADDTLLIFPIPVQG